MLAVGSSHVPEVGSARHLSYAIDTDSEDIIYCIYCTRTGFLMDAVAGDALQIAAQTLFFFQISERLLPSQGWKRHETAHRLYSET
jgi:hypothetical protein